MHKISTMRWHKNKWIDVKDLNVRGKYRAFFNFAQNIDHGVTIEGCLEHYICAFYQKCTEYRPWNDPINKTPVYINETNNMDILLFTS